MLPKKGIIKTPSFDKGFPGSTKSGHKVKFDLTGNPVVERRTYDTTTDEDSDESSDGYDDESQFYLPKIRFNKLGPKHRNPSLPSLAQLENYKDKVWSSNNSTNPFLCHDNNDNNPFKTRHKNPFASKSALQLGEDFFSSLFSAQTNDTCDNAVTTNPNLTNAPPPLSTADPLSSKAPVPATHTTPDAPTLQRLLAYERLARFSLNIRGGARRAGAPAAGGPED